MFPPAVTGSGESLLVTARSARVCTEVVAVPVSFVALVSSDATLAFTVAVLMMSPVVSGAMCTLIVKVAVPLRARVPKVQVTVPLGPVVLGGGVVGAGKLQSGLVAETKLTCGGRTSVTVPPL